jgi:energy-coupling factor transporter ATP-binding protein EcfA2
MNNPAIQYRASGLNVVPCNSEKRPTLLEYGQYYLEPYTGSGFEGAYGIGVLCGITSGNLEVIDIDSKYQQHRSLFESIKEMICNGEVGQRDGQELWDSLTIEKSPSGGAHIFYRCEAVEGNKKLASRYPDADEIEAAENQGKKVPKSIVLVETRGMGGFIVCAPTPGYEIIQGSMMTIPTITFEERQFLLDASRSLNEVETDTHSYYPTPQKNESASNTQGHVPAWTDYNNKVSALDLAIQAGWKNVGKRGRFVLLAHPAQKTNKGTSFYDPTYNYIGTFSTNTELEPYERYAGKGRTNAYTPFKLYALWHTGGDTKLAAKKLYAEGYGDRLQKKHEPIPERIGIVSNNNRPSVTVPNIEHVKSCEVLIITNTETAGMLEKHGMKNVFIADTPEGDEKEKELTDQIAHLLSIRKREKTIICGSQEYSEQWVNVIYEYGHIPQVYTSEIDVYQFIDTETGDIITLSPENKIINAPYAWDIWAESHPHKVCEWICSMPSLKLIRATFGMVPAKYKQVKAYAQDYISEKKDRLEEEAAARAERKSVVYNGTYTLAKNGKGVLQVVCEGELTIPYQLPGTEIGDCEWIIRLRAEDEDTGNENNIYLRIDNDAIGNPAGFSRIFRNARIPVTVGAAQITALNNALIPESKQAKRMDLLGWHTESRIWFSANRAYSLDGNEFLIPNEVSIVEKKEDSFYMPYNDAQNKATEIQKAFSYRHSDLTMSDVSKWYKRQWGAQGVFVLIWGVASGYADFLSKAANSAAPFFPLIYCQGQKGSGKSTMLETLRFFYTQKIETISLRSSNNTAAAIQSTLNAYSNLPVLFDDYGSPEGKISTDLATGIGVSAFNRRVELKRDINNLSKVQDPTITATLAFSSNYYPKDSTGAFQNRMVHFLFNQTVFTDTQNKEFRDGLKQFEEQGLCTAWICEVIGNRPVIERDFLEEYSRVSKYLKDTTIDHEADSRSIACYAMIATVGRILTRVGVSFSMSENEILETARTAMIQQLSALRAKSAIQIFFEIVKIGIDMGALIEGQQYDYLPDGYTPKNAPDRAINEEVLMINFMAMWKYYTIEARKMGIEAERESDLRHELEISPAFDGREIGGSAVSAIHAWRFSVPAANQEAKKGTSKVTRAYALIVSKLEENYGFSMKARG